MRVAYPRTKHNRQPGAELRWVTNAVQIDLLFKGSGGLNASLNCSRRSPRWRTCFRTG